MSTKAPLKGRGLKKNTSAIKEKTEERLRRDSQKKNEKERKEKCQAVMKKQK